MKNVVNKMGEISLSAKQSSCETIKEDKAKTYIIYFKSPIGLIKITGIDEGITGVEFCDSEEHLNMNKVTNVTEVTEFRKVTEISEVNEVSAINEDLPQMVKKCVKQLDEYFRGERRNFSLNIIFTQGTEFQKKVWKALMEIPYGKTASYGEIAKTVGNEKAARAVGNANNKNPISIIVPCHRVIGSNGSLIGYGGGLWRKQWLLDHEKKGSLCISENISKNDG